MNRYLVLTTLITLTCLGMVTLRLRAAEKPSAEYVAAMKVLAVVSAQLPQLLATDDVDGLDKAVIKARPALITLEQYWTTRQVDDALATAQTASKAIAEISVAVHLMSDHPNPIATEGAQESIKTFRASCDSCHAVHRTTLPDGSFEIR